MPEKVPKQAKQGRRVTERERRRERGREGKEAVQLWGSPCKSFIILTINN